MYESPDTPSEIKEIQRQIWMSKTPAERFRIAAAHSDDMRRARINTLKIQHPELTHEQIILLILKNMRAEDETIAWLDTIGVWEKLPEHLRP
jgi:hypothetical protein